MKKKQFKVSENLTAAKDLPLGYVNGEEVW